MLRARRRFKQRVAVFSLPDLAGKSVLVSGPEAHAFAAQAERGGAADVATARHLADCDVAAVGQWDVVLYLGELHDVEDPLGALRSVRAVTRELAVVETEAAAIGGLEHEAVWRFVAGEDGRGRWEPNLSGLGGALTAAGFSDVRAVAGAPTELVDRRGGPHAYRAVVQGAVAR